MGNEARHVVGPGSRREGLSLKGVAESPGRTTIGPAGGRGGEEGSSSSALPFSFFIFLQTRGYFLRTQDVKLDSSLHPTRLVPSRRGR